MSRYKYTKEELAAAVKKSFAIAGVCRELNIRPVGGNYKTLKSLIKELNLDITHFTGKGWNSGSNYIHYGKKYSLLEILIENSPYKSTTKLKNRLFNEGLKEKKCEACNLKEWMNKIIPLELNHKNGNNTDNRIENLEIICCNCHAQTTNYRGKNILSYKSEKIKNEFLNKEIKVVNIKKKVENNKCIHCSKELNKKNKKFCSTLCYRESERKENEIPKVPEILNAFNIYKNFRKVGLSFGVSDNTVRNWCSNYGILEMITRK
jgi:hypothetical protein